MRGLHPTSHRHSRRQVPVVIETERGLLVAELLRHKQPVIVLNPAVVARYRGRLSPARKKDDKSDAELLANIVRMDGTRHRPLAARSPQAAAIKELARAQHHAKWTRQYHHNQLRSQLREYFPAALQAWDHLPHGLLRTEARAVLALAPTPGRAARVTKKKLFDTLDAAGRTRELDEHAARLRDLFNKPQLRQPPDVEVAMGQRMLTTLAMVDHACRILDELTEQVSDAFLEHPDAPVYLSFPGVGSLTGARLLAEIGDDPKRFTDARGLRAYAGIAPLTWASGNSTTVTHPKVANRYLKGTCHLWAFTALRHSPACRAYYDQRREAGDAYASALRRLAGKLLSSLHRCLIQGETYREERVFPTRDSQETPPDRPDP